MTQPNDFLRICMLAVLLPFGSLVAAQTSGANPKDAPNPAPATTPVIRPAADLPFTRNGAPAPPLPPSKWQQDEKAAYANLLSRRQFDVLVVPFQVQDHAFSLSNRSLMTAELAQLLARTQFLNIPDTQLVARALGDTSRRLDPREVYQLADRLGVKRIIWGYVGHNLSGTMALTLQSQSRSPAGGLNAQTILDTKNYEGLAFTDTSAAVDVYAALLPKILSDLGFVSKETLILKSTRDLAAALPANPRELFRGEAFPAYDALVLQWLAALVPAYQERARERLAEKSMLAVRRMPPSAAQYHYLKARALMLLGLRPAALKVLGNPATPEERALVAALNGDVVKLRASASEMRPGMFRLLTELDANRIAVEYGLVPDGQIERELARLHPPGDIWPFLIGRAMSDGFGWFQQTPLEVKALLDREFPLPGYSVRDIFAPLAAQLGSDEAQTLVDLSVFRHVRRYIETDKQVRLDAAWADRATAYAYLELLDAIGEDDLLRAPRLQVQMQARPREAMQALQRIEGTYEGHPRFALDRGIAERMLANSESWDKAEAHIKAAYTDLAKSAYWSLGQTRVAADAFDELAGIPQPGYPNAGNPFHTDRPAHPWYLIWAGGPDPNTSERNALAAVDSATSEFQTVVNLVKTLDMMGKPVDPALESLEGRFNGYPVLSRLRAERSLKKGDEAGAMKHYAAGVKMRPDDWEMVFNLGKLEYAQGSVVEAAKRLLGYPGFVKFSGLNSVGLANNAFEAGSMFYWSGDFAQAIPLFRIAADLQTGSASSITGATRLQMLNGNLPAAAAGIAARIARYNSEPSMRDMLGIQHALGNAKEAWGSFNAILARTNGFDIWESAYVGQRMDRATDAQVAAWAKTPVYAAIGLERNPAVTSLLRTGVMDRSPSASLATLVGEMDWPVWITTRPQARVVREGANGRVLYQVGPKSVDGMQVPPTMFDPFHTKVRTKSDLVYFIEAYRALYARDYTGAFAGLSEALKSYDASIPVNAYLLPYYTFAAGKSGNAGAADETLSAVAADHRTFEYFLARGVAAGMAGRTDESMVSLKRAKRELYRTTHSRHPIYPTYQYAEMCEWLFLHNKNPAFKDELLSFSRVVEKTQPWLAWPYAMSAVHATDAVEKGRAIAMISYLDPNSIRLSSLPKGEIEQAVKQYGKDNPFLRRIEFEAALAQGKR